MKWSIIIVMISIFTISLWGHGGFEDLGNSLEMWSEVIDIESIFKYISEVYHGN
jgi:hypothetical protein